MYSRKCPTVERFIGTLKRLLYQKMDHEHSLRWKALLPKVLDIYMNRKHKTIKMTPIQALKDENQILLKETYRKKYKKIEKKWEKSKHNVGDTVRIYLKKGTFDKGHTEDFSTEYFKIKSVLTNLPTVRYTLEGINGEKINGNFFQNELVPYIPTADTKYVIEKILKEKYAGSKKQYFVKWFGWSSIYNSWVKAADIENL